MISLSSLLGAVVALLVIIFTYFKLKYQYWKNKNLPYIEPTIPFGNLPNFFQRRQPLQERIRDIYKHFRNQNVKHGGFYFLASPAYMPIGCDYIKNIMTKDFAHFIDRGTYYNEKHDPLSAHLFSIGGTKWKNLRVKLSPTFTTGKMKAMFTTLTDCGKVFNEFISTEAEKNIALDIKDLTSRFTTDVISSCAFGLESHTITDQDSPFIIYGKKIFKRTKLKSILTGLAVAYPNLGRFVGFKILPEDTTKFFMNVVKTTVGYREKNDYRRNDFLQILIDLKNNKLDDEMVGDHDGKSLTIEEIAAQCFVFFIGGYDTSSTLMTFAMLELCKNLELQGKLREEISSVLKKYNDEITYDGIMEMKYMQQVFDETLRLYPPVPFLTRKCVKDYKVADTDVVIEEGTTCWISILGIHHDEEYYPDPEKFDPDRFSEENKDTRHQYSYLPFGEGPRICIGQRFGLMQAKVGLAILLKNYKFTLDPQTELPVQMDPSTVITTAKGGVWLRAERIIQHF